MNRQLGKRFVLLALLTALGTLLWPQLQSELGELAAQELSQLENERPKETISVEGATVRGKTATKNSDLADTTASAPVADRPEGRTEGWAAGPGVDPGSYSSTEYSSYETVPVTATTSTAYSAGSYYPTYLLYGLYFWRPYNYSYGSWYNRDSGFFGTSSQVQGYYGGAGRTAVWNPETGSFARGQAIWDGDEIARRGYAYNPGNDTGVVSRGYWDDDDNEGSRETVVERGEQSAVIKSERDGDTTTGEFETFRGSSGEFERHQDDGHYTSEGKLEHGDRSATYQAEFDRQGGSATFKGSEGASGALQRDFNDGEISGSGSLTTREGLEIHGETSRSSQGIRRDYETSEGGSGTLINKGGERTIVAESANGDHYVGGEKGMYKKSDEGWQQVGASSKTATGSSVRPEWERKSAERSQGLQTQGVKRQTGGFRARRRR